MCRMFPQQASQPSLTADMFVGSTAAFQAHAGGMRVGVLHACCFPPPAHLQLMPTNVPLLQAPLHSPLLHNAHSMAPQLHGVWACSLSTGLQGCTSGLHMGRGGSSTCSASAASRPNVPPHTATSKSRAPWFRRRCRMRITAGPLFAGPLFIACPISHNFKYNWHHFHNEQQGMGAGGGPTCQ